MTPTGSLVTTRLILKRGALPRWAPRGIMSRAESWVVEESEVDPFGKTIRCITKNLDHVKVMQVEESVFFRQTPEGCVRAIQSVFTCSRILQEDAADHGGEDTVQLWLGHGQEDREPRPEQIQGQCPACELRPIFYSRTLLTGSQSRDGISLILEMLRQARPQTMGMGGVSMALSNSPSLYESRNYEPRD